MGLPPPGSRVYLDSNALIFAVEESPWNDVFRELFAEIDRGSLIGIVSEIALVEVLAKPIEKGADRLVAVYEQLLGDESALIVAKVDRPLLRQCADVQVRYGHKPIDSIHVATAMSFKCDCFITHDNRLGRKLDGDLQWVRPDDLRKATPQP